MRILLSAVLAAAISFSAPPAGAEDRPSSSPDLPQPSHEIFAFAGAGMLASTWRGDLAADAPLWLGYRYRRVLSIDALTRLGYATVDERLLTYLSLGATVWGRLGTAQPYLRLALVHQHEESRAAVDDDPQGALFGVGNGIRHRGGYAASAGLLFPLERPTRLGAWFVGVDAWTTYFPDNRGPSLYAGASGVVGFAFRL